MSTYFSLPPSAQSAIGYTLNGNLSITTLRELSLSPMECLTFFCEHWTHHDPAPSQRKLLRLEHFDMQCESMGS
jgi:hypothetical protein